MKTTCEHGVERRECSQCDLAPTIQDVTLEDPEFGSILRFAVEDGGITFINCIDSITTDGQITAETAEQFARELLRCAPLAREQAARLAAVGDEVEGFLAP